MNSRTSPYVQTTRALAAGTALAAAVLASALSLAAPARAQGGDALRHREPPRYNQVALSAEAGREVPNDLASAMMVVELTDSSAAAAAAQVTKIANEAL